MRLPQLVGFSLVVALGECLFEFQSVGTLQQPSSLNPKTNVDLRQLVWGKVNFLHTTDTHAWYAGHLNQKNYGADWGDYVSFVKHLRDYADSIGVDLLVIDSGDKHDGNGLSDASLVNGEVSTPFFTEVDFDLLTIGNHELYLSSGSFQEYDLVVNKFQDKYLAANVQILKDYKWVDFGSKYRVFQTKNQNLTVLSFGFLFNFKRFNEHTRVIDVQKSVKQAWFQKALKDNLGKVDLIVVVGHLPIQRFDEFPEVLAIKHAIREYYPNIIIQFFGGHSHVRDFARLDSRAAGLQSGRYCETVGFLGLNFEPEYQNHVSQAVQFNRRYIDFNLYSFHNHSNKTYDSFPTSKGVKITKSLNAARHALNITDVYGIVPRNYLVIDNSYPQNKSLYSFLENSVLPRLKSDSKGHKEKKSRAVLINSGSIRYDLYKGPFTKDTIYIVSPFQNKWLVLPDQPLQVVQKVIATLNGLNYILNANEKPNLESLKRPELVASRFKNSPQVIIPATGKLSKGYVTCDDGGCDGDDTPHLAYNHGKDKSPNIVNSLEIVNGNVTSVDLVFYDFLQPYLVWALDQAYNKKTTYTFDHYGGSTVGELLKDYVVENWSNKNNYKASE